MSKPDSPDARRPVLNIKRRARLSADDLRLLLGQLARRVDFPQRPDTPELGRLLSAEEPTPMTIDGREVEFPALDELLEAYLQRYPRQIYAFNVGRPILERVLAAEGSIGAKIYFGILPGYERTLRPFARFIWRLIYRLQRLLPAEARPYPSREPRQLLIYALDGNGNPLPLSEARAASPMEQIHGTEASLSAPAGAVTGAFVPNIVMADGARMGAEMTNTCPPN